MASVTFKDLLEQVAKSQGHDPAELTAERAKLAAEVDKLEAKLTAAKSNLAIVLAKLQDPVRQATKAALLMGIEVPDEFAAKTGKPNGKPANGGSFKWEPGALPNGNRTEDLTPKEWEISRAMWALSKGSGGSAGRDGEGVLSAAEFWALVKDQTGKSELAPGEVVALVLPNGRPVQVSRLR